MSKLTKIYFSKEELEVVYGLKLAKINKLIRTRELIFHKIGRDVRFKKTDVDKFMDKHRIE